MEPKKNEEETNLEAARQALNKAMGMAGKDVVVPEEKIIDAEKKAASDS